MIRKVRAVRPRVSSWFRRHFDGRFGIHLHRETSIAVGSPSANSLQNISARAYFLEDDSPRASSPENILFRADLTEDSSTSGDSLRDMPPRPTFPEVESSGIPNTGTVLISSNSETVSKLCDVCSRIPAWFWTQKLEHNEETFVKLQSFKEMRAEAQNGCGLCRVLCSKNNILPRGRRISQGTLLKSGTCELVKRKIGSFAAESTPVYEIICRFKEATMESGTLYPIPSSWHPRSLATADKNSHVLLIEDWINNCRLNHISCNNITKDFLPTRLLDLEAFNRISLDYKEDIKLVHSTSSQFHSIGLVPQYITLSHCWGSPDKRPVTTTQANLAVRMEGISFADLPRTFQDAVVLTRKLGQRYLWIDSLCIIQDDEDDWANEASMMAKVCSQSYCTLAALSSKDGTEGLQTSSEAQTYERFMRGIDLGAHNGNKGLSIVRLFADRSDWRIEYNGYREYLDDEDDGQKICPLRYRAWALQEKELSTRSIHFGFRQMLWECRELKGTSQLPWSQVHGYSDNSDTKSERNWTESQPEDSILSCKMMARWLDLCVEYSERCLTKETDKLPALSGIARSFQKYFPNDKYIAGIWSSHLPIALLWLPAKSRHHKERATAEFVAPSWSWTSHTKGILYLYQISTLQRLVQRMARETSGPADIWIDELEVVNIIGQPKHSDDYGALEEGAALELRGAFLFELHPDPERSYPWEIFFFCKDGVPAGSFYPDAPSYTGLPQGKSLCLGISCDEWFGSVTGLILKEHIRDGSPVYSRVGCVKDVKPSFWDGSEPRQITLI